MGGRKMPPIESLSTDLVKIKNLRDDLGVNLSILDPKPGQIVVVQPRNDLIHFSDTYMSFILEVLHALRPDVKFMVLPESNTTLRVQAVSP
jgi:hypothetical protein